MDATVTADALTPRRWGPWRATDVIAVAAAAVTVLAVLSYVVRGAPLEELFGSWVIHNAPFGVGTLLLAAALRHQPDNRAARFLFVASVLSASHVAVFAAANALAAADPTYALSPTAGAALDLSGVPPLPGGLIWFGSVVWVPAAGLMLVYGLPLLPDGHWPSPRWRVIERVAIVPITMFAAAWALYSYPGRDVVIVAGDLPSGTPLIDTLLVLGGVGLAACAAVSVAAVVLKHRRASSAQRRRMRPVGIVVLFTLVSMIVLYPWQAVWAVASAVSVFALLVAITVAMTRHHLFDIEVLVSRAVTAAVLAAFVTVAYVGIVIGIGYLLGDRDNLVLALTATAVVAVAFEPLRRRIAAWTRRLVLGTRSTPTEVLGQLSDGLVEAGSIDDVLVRVAELLVDGTGAVRAELRTDGRPVAVAGDRGVAAPATRTAVVRNDGVVLGEVVLAATRPDLMLPADEALLERVAALLGPVVRNAALAAELQETVAELRASRERLVLAEENVRRSLERDIHDGAQQQLLGLRLRLGLASALADQGEVERLAQVVAEAAEDTEAAIRGLRDLARFLHPPVLEQEGLAAALRSRLRHVPLDAVVDAPRDLPRFDAGVEAAVHLCCLEAIQNATKHAAATTLTVRLRQDAGQLVFEVIDDGCGFAEVEPGVGLHSIRDRVEALGGTLGIASAPGQGTHLIGRVPVHPSAQPSLVDDSSVSAR